MIGKQNMQPLQPTITDSKTNGLTNKVLELFAGSRSIGKAAESLGMKVISSDIEPFENIDYCVSILDFEIAKVPFIPDIIWASPPCQGFSVAAIGKNWVSGEPFTPKTDSARLGIALAKKNSFYHRTFQ